jgi:hypothetical protein
MILLLLFAALASLIAASLLSSPELFALASVTLLTALAGLGRPARVLLLVFWLWIGALLAYLLGFAEDLALIAGLPVPACCMLLGIWVLPVTIWPLGFSLTFKRWTGR